MVGYNNIKNFGPGIIPSRRTKTKNIIIVRPKLIRDETFFEKRNRYLGTFILLNILALLIRDVIQTFVDSLKYANKRFPQNR